MKELYAALLDGSYGQRETAIPRPEGASRTPFYLQTSPETAELIKHASNAFLATKISFINAVSTIAESVGADIEDVRMGMGTDKRIGSHFLRAGIGYGGSCFPKDVSAFQAVAQACGFEFKLLDAVRRLNDEQPKRFVAKVRKALWTVKNKHLAVLGLAFKSGTDDIRESPAIHIIKMLLKEGCRITAFDPAAIDRARLELGDSVGYAPDAYATMLGADALLILTEWSEFGALDLSRVKALLKYPVVLDGRNLYSREEMSRIGLNYYSIGRAAVELSYPVPEETKLPVMSMTSGEHA
jgi:UDPglucose 6-dehydrogenase